MRQVQLHLAALTASHPVASVGPQGRPMEEGVAANGIGDVAAGGLVEWTALETKVTELEQETSDLQVALKQATAEQETLRVANVALQTELERLQRELTAAQARTEGQFHIHEMVDDLPRRRIVT
ncbi:MAG: hypothetical protein R2867_00535 [Caldilineaceae bacterium]